MEENLPNSQNNITVLSICSEDFLAHFDDGFLSNINITPWEKKFGPKDKLYLTVDSTFSSLIIDSSLSYSKENILSWVRTLVPGGLLILESLDYSIPEIISLNNSEIIEFLPNNNKKIWIFKKKYSISEIELHSQMINAYNENLSDDEMLLLISKLEQKNIRFCGLIAPLFAKLMIYKKLGLIYPAIESLQKYLDTNPLHHSQMTTIINSILYSEDLYHKGFMLRKLLMDRFGLRTRTPPPERITSLRWNGEPIQDKTILVWTEFGLGDEIMFSQFAYYFKTQGAKKVIFIAQKPIVSLLKTSLDIDEVFAPDEINENLPLFDFWTYPHDILAYIPKSFSQIRKRSPYLFPSQNLIKEYSMLFNQDNKINIGIVWRGNTTHENDALRSIHDLRYIEYLFNIRDINWYCFQKQCNEKELELLERYEIPHITKDFNDMEQTAAAMNHIDYFITVDTSTSHVAGAIGIPTLLLLPYVVDWRWSLETESNVWYPNIVSFRCPKPEPNWDEPIEKVKRYLQDLIKK